jgi:RNA polymerase sigma factor (sigma-70 family)
MMNKQRRITRSYFETARRQYMPLIQKLAFQMGDNKTQIEEMVVQAIKELLRCMICYNKSGSFITFFHGRLFGIFKHMQDADRRADRIQKISLDHMSNISDFNHDMDFRMMVQECLECLNENEHYVITELFFNNKTIREISTHCETAPSTIYHIKTSAINKMRQKCQV